MTYEDYKISVKFAKNHMARKKTMVDYINQLYNKNVSLEAKIAELELKLADADSYFDGIHTEAPKTCEGCKYNRFGCDSLGYAVECTHRSIYPCLRACDDYYEPKDNK